jgi:hypothetical protein
MTAVTLLPLLGVSFVTLLFKQFLQSSKYVSELEPLPAAAMVMLPDN